MTFSFVFLSLLQELLRPKNGIEVQNPVDLGALTSGRRVRFEVGIKNSGRDEISLVSAKVSGHSDGSIDASRLSCPKTVRPKETSSVEFEFVAKNFGRNKILVVFKFRRSGVDVGASGDNVIVDEDVISCGTHVLAEVVDPELKNLAPNSNSGDARKSTIVRYLRDGERVSPG